MRRRVLAILLLVLVAAPTAIAQAQLDIVNAKHVRIKNSSGDEVKTLQLNRGYSLEVEVSNVATTNFTGEFSVIFSITGNGTDYTFNRTVGPLVRSMPPAGSTNVTLDWTPTLTGNFVLEVYIQGQPKNKHWTADFQVAGSESRADTLAESSIRYAWFFAAWLGTMILFFAVVRIRKKPGP